jgi:hypothetical protein
VITATATASVAVQAALSPPPPSPPSTPTPVLTPPVTKTTPSPLVPVGLYVVLASRTIGSAGGVLNATSGATVLRLKISAKALLHSIDFTLTRPKKAPSSKVIPHGMQLLIQFTLLTSTLDGKLIGGSFSQHSGVITVSSARISKHAQLLVWQPSTQQYRKVTTTLSNGKAVVYVQRDGEFLIVVPATSDRGLTSKTAR